MAEVKILLTMDDTTMATIKHWLNDYSSMAGEPLTDVEAVEALFCMGDQLSEYLDLRDDIKVEKISPGPDVKVE